MSKVVNPRGKERLNIRLGEEQVKAFREICRRLQVAPHVIYNEIVDRFIEENKHLLEE